jgi:hypothetical protein
LNTSAAALGPRESAKARGATLISFLFTSTPSAPPLLNMLRTWAVGKKKSDCGEQRFAPEFVLLSLSGGLLPSLVELLDAVNATRNSRPAARETTFLVLTETEVADGDKPAHTHVSHANLVAYEAAAELVAAQYDGVVLVPVSAGTAAGIEAGALRHEQGSSFHFLGASLPDRLVIPPGRARSLSWTLGPQTLVRSRPLLPGARGPQRYAPRPRAAPRSARRPLLDPGRYYLAHVVLNAMHLARARRGALRGPDASDA